MGSNTNIRTGGLLSYEEALKHINVLELSAVLFGLKALVAQRGIHVKILCDNTTEVHTINNIGTSHSPPCNTLVRKIWAVAIRNDLLLSAAHLPGRFNDEADEETRKNESRLEWMLNQ